MEPLWNVRHIVSMKKVIILPVWKYGNIVAKDHSILRDVLLWLFVLQIRVYLKWPRHAFYIICTPVRTSLCSTQETLIFQYCPSL